MTDLNRKLIFKASIILIAVGLFVFVASFLVPRALVALGKGSLTQRISTKDSYVLGEKVMARADGEDKCVVNVFILDNKGRGVQGKQVQLRGLGSLTANTDAMGKAVFEVKTQTAKQYELKATVNGLDITKTVKVTFVD